MSVADLLLLGTGGAGGGGGGGFAVVAHAIKGGIGATSTGVDTTGANLLIVLIGALTFNTVNSVTDSKGNTWTAGPTLTGGTVDIFVYYCYGATVGTSHTVTVTMNASSQASFEFVALSGATTSSPVDQSSTSGGPQPGSITPTVDNEIVITVAACQVGGADVTAVDGGFTVLDHQAWNNYVAFSAAYLIQTTAAAANPTWSSTYPGFNSDVAIVSFKS